MSLDIGATERKVQNSLQHADYGALVISLDFELYWGVADLHAPGSSYSANVLGARKLIPRLLALFEQAGLSATWCTVGLLFADNLVDAQRYFPEKRPRYAKRELSAYATAGTTGSHERLYYAPELVRCIASRPKQEVGTHTFSHYYCLEPGQDIQDFEADLIAAKRIAEKFNLSLRSMVFPRNQVNPSYLRVLVRHGVLCYRGTELSWMNSAAPRSEQRHWIKRAGRFADAYVNLSGHNTYSWDEVLDRNGLCNVRASRYLRPYSSVMRAFDKLRVQRVLEGMEEAARAHRIFHLWWHPEDMGRNPEENLDVVRAIASRFGHLRNVYGMQALSMRDIAHLVSPTRLHPTATTSLA